MNEVCSYCGGSIFQVHRRGSRPFWRHGQHSRLILGPHDAEPERRAADASLLDTGIHNS
jgi:hypothetical protein